MKKPTMVAWMTCALLAVHTAAQAQSGNQDSDDRASPGRPVEITPYAMLGSGPASGVGTAVRWPIGGRFGVELETELRRAELTAVNVALSLLYDLPAIGRVTPYLAAGVGLERFGTAVGRPDGPPLLGSGTGISFNAGGGVRMPVTDRWGVRSDARWRHGTARGQGDQWRIFNGATIGVGGGR
jgi:opacity protein-like surface antigen